MNYIFCLLLITLVGCNNTKLGLADPSATTTTPPPTTPVGTAPVADDLTPTAANRDREKVIYLTYTDAENDEATVCAVSDLVGVTVTTPCSCSRGACSVGVSGSTETSASFNYTVTANGQTSNSASVNFNIEKASFVSVWRLGDAAFGDGTLSLTLPLKSGHNYNMEVDWGDGTANSTVTSYNDPDAVHVYASAGDYTVTIKGLAEHVSTRSSTDGEKLIRVMDLGDMGWKNLSDAFSYAMNLTSFAGGYTADVTNMSGMFDWTPNLLTVDVTSFNTSNVTRMNRMFFGASKVTSLDLSSFDTSKVTTMQMMFWGMNEVTSINLSSFDTHAVLEMTSMFANTYKLASLNLSHFQTAQVTDMGSMFYHARSLTTLDLSNFNVYNNDSFWEIFRGTYALETLNLNNWDTSRGVPHNNAYYESNPNLKVYCTEPNGRIFGWICETGL